MARPAACKSRACVRLARARSPTRSRRKSRSDLGQNIGEVAELISAKMRSSFLCPVFVYRPRLPALNHPVWTRYHTFYKPVAAADTDALAIGLEQRLRTHVSDLENTELSLAMPVANAKDLAVSFPPGVDACVTGTNRRRNKFLCRLFGNDLLHGKSKIRRCTTSHSSPSCSGKRCPDHGGDGC